MRASIVITLIACVSCVLNSGCRDKSKPVTPDKPIVSGGGGEDDATKTRFLLIHDVSKAVVLDQGWDDATANWFYDIDQGSQFLPYQWFLHLEQADSQEAFRSPKHMRKLGYLPRSPSKNNADGLPIGFVKNKGTGREWMGLTCAACHTNQINYDDTAYLIDGAPALSNISQMMIAVVESLQKTLDDSEKFDRFATAVGEGSNKPELRAEMQKMLEIRQGYNDRNIPKDPKLEHGYARIDAFGSILNETSVRNLEIPANQKDADAPVSIPFLWDTPQHDFVQWNGSAKNGLIGSLGRNSGEVLGVFGDVEIPEEPPLIGYKSSVEVGNLKEIEETVAELWSPKWPKTFPKLDTDAVARGKALFGTYCISCHASIDRTDPNRKVIASMDVVGTDPKMSKNFSSRIVETGRLEGTHMGFNPLGPKFEARESAAKVLRHQVIGAILGAWKEAPEDQLDAHRARVFASLRDLPMVRYKGRPLNGIWATAPYLHNGSVPNLYQILLPAEERDEEFWVGSRDFDAKDVGFVSTEAEGLFRFDTSVPGNTNVGHEYGTGVSDSDGGDGKPKLTDEQRRDLLEYLKDL